MSMTQTEATTVIAEIRSNPDLAFQLEHLMILMATGWITPSAFGSDVRHLLQEIAELPAVRGSVFVRNTRDDLYRHIMLRYHEFMARFPDQSFDVLLQKRYRVDETRLMTLEQLTDLVSFMESQLGQGAA